MILQIEIRKEQIIECKEVFPIFMLFNKITHYYTENGGIIMTGCYPGPFFHQTSGKYFIKWDELSKNHDSKGEEWLYKKVNQIVKRLKVIEDVQNS